MKKISLYIASATLLFFTSCSLFEIDNYDEPSETLKGEVVDVATGEPVLTDQGSEGIRVRLTEISWGENVTPNPDFFCRPDGTFQNTKLFKGEYNIQIDGPFIPLVRETAEGVPVADESITTEISGTKNVRFEVQPFLKIEWVGEPEVINGKVRVQVRVTRAVSDADFQTKISQMGGYDANFLNVTDVQLFVSNSSSVGYRARDTRYSNEIQYAGTAFNALLGQTITIESKGTLTSGHVMFIRAAARINFDTPRGTGIRRYNYNEAIQVLIP